MSSSGKLLAGIVELNTDLVLNCLDSLSEEDALARPLESGNSIGFLVAHLADARHYFAKLLGSPVENPLEEQLGGVTAIDDVKSLPSLDSLRETWSSIAAHLTTCLEMASPETLDADSGQPFPVKDRTVLGGVAFLLQHEAYHLGQIGMLRKSLGHASMSYDRRSG